MGDSSWNQDTVELAIFINGHTQSGSKLKKSATIQHIQILWKIGPVKVLV